MDLKGGVSFRGTFDPTGQVATAFGYAGWGGPINIEGTLAASPEMLFGDASSTDIASLDLKATLSKSSTAPAWLTDRTTTFEFSLDSSGKAELQAHDDVTVAVDGKTDEFKGDVSIASTGDVSASLANLGTLALPFGLDNVGADIANTRLGLSYDGTTKTFAGTLGFDVTLPSHSEPFTVDAALKVSNDGSASADLSIDGSLSVQDLATFAAGVLDTRAVTIPAADAFTLDKLSFAVEHHSRRTSSASAAGDDPLAPGERRLHAAQQARRSRRAAARPRPLRPELRLQRHLPLRPLPERHARRPRREPEAAGGRPRGDAERLHDPREVRPDDAGASFFSTVYDTVPGTIDLGGGLRCTEDARRRAARLGAQDLRLDDQRHRARRQPRRLRDGERARRRQRRSHRPLPEGDASRVVGRLAAAELAVADGADGARVLLRERRGVGQPLDRG